MRFVHGYNMHDFYFIPTIRMERYCEVRYLTIEWLNWYVGFQWEVNE